MRIPNQSVGVNRHVPTMHISRSLVTPSIANWRSAGSLGLNPGAHFGGRLQEQQLGIVFLDDAPTGNCSSIPSKCANNSIDSTCSQLACRARKEGCAGDYSSGECKDIADLHEISMCEFARDGCGKSLPKNSWPRDYDSFYIPVPNLLLR